jgi:hypothetical protein
MIGDKSRRAILVCAILVMSTIALGTPTALAANAEKAPPIHEGPWPIRNGHNYQPTEHELRALHQEDVTPDQAREIDRLYDQLLATPENVLQKPIIDSSSDQGCDRAVP